MPHNTESDKSLRETMTKVVYIAGWVRSGSTLLGNILGSYPSSCHLGEVTHLFTPAHPTNNLCGCGLVFEECPVWGRALHESGLADNLQNANHLRLLTARLRHTPGLVYEWKRREQRSLYSDLLSRLYPAVSTSAGAEFIIDSSKSPGEAMAAATAIDCNTKIIHLVRDPRGCAYSTSQRAKQHHPNLSTRTRTLSPQESSIRWLQSNGLVELVRAAIPRNQSAIVRYEDLMANPVEVVGSLAKWIGLDSDASPFTGPSTVELKENHTAMGNPNRFSAHNVSLNLDEEWRQRMSNRHYWSATFPALPLLRRYNYDFEAKG